MDLILGIFWMALMNLDLVLMVMSSTICYLLFFRIPCMSLSLKPIWMIMKLWKKISAGYIMTEINFGRFLMLLPGVRYEYTENDMTGRKGWINDDTYEPDLDSVDSYVADTTATSTYSNWFPMIHARVRPAKWCDLRLAYTETISRPRLDYKLPKKKVSGSDNIVSFGPPGPCSANFKKL